MSSSQIEIDISAAHFTNRKKLQNKMATEKNKKEVLQFLRQLSQSAKPADKNSISIPQTDGADNDLYTPSKYAWTTIKNQISNKRSPRTLKSAERNRFKPYQGISTFLPKPMKKLYLETSSNSEAASASSNETYRPFVNRVKRKIKRNIFETSDSLSKCESPRKKSASRTKSLTNSSENSLKPIRNNSRLNFDKTEVNITCNLKTPKRSKKNNELKMLKCKVRLKKSYETNFLKFIAKMDETEDPNEKTDRNNIKYVSKDLVTVGNTFLNDKTKQKIEIDESETDDSLAIEDLSIQQKKLKMKSEETAKNNQIKSKYIRLKSDDLQTNQKDLFYLRKITKTPDQRYTAKRLIRNTLARRANSVISYNEFFDDFEIDSEESYQTQFLKIAQHLSNYNKNEISAKSSNSQNKNLKQFRVKIEKQINTPTKTKTFSTNSKTNLNIDKTKNKVSLPGVQPHIIKSLTSGLNCVRLNKSKTPKQNKAINKTNATNEYKTDLIKKCKVQINKLIYNEHFR